ncbi:hypothetical protein DFAR_850005 [Desulfarculales bacterium]
MTPCMGRCSWWVTSGARPTSSPSKEIVPTAEVLGVAKRFEYATRLGVLALVTGDVGSGKSTALRWAASRQHPSGVSDHLGHRLTGLHPGTL